jgi:transketolase
VILARTVFGCGVSFMESQIAWHYLPLDAAQCAQALAELEARR